MIVAVCFHIEYKRHQHHLHDHNITFIFHSNVEGTTEWGMVELQGTLESRNDISWNGLYIGDLHFDNKVRFMSSYLD